MRGALAGLKKLLLGKLLPTGRGNLPHEQFRNVPEKLLVFVRDYMSEYKRTGDRNLLYLEAAGGVIRQYLGVSVFTANVNRFFDARVVNDEGNLAFTYPLRVILIGESLFLLRSCKGFSEICMAEAARSPVRLLRNACRQGFFPSRF
jgi:hypothetical protein